jgi:hypothetical protein
MSFGRQSKRILAELEGKLKAADDARLPEVNIVAQWSLAQGNF